jgi:hypothetical protein
MADRCGRAWEAGEKHFDRWLTPQPFLEPQEEAEEAGQEEPAMEGTVVVSFMLISMSRRVRELG